MRVVARDEVEGAAHELDAGVRELLAEGLGLEVRGADGLLQKEKGREIFSRGKRR